MKRLVSGLTLAAAFVLGASPSRADTVVLKSGKRIKDVVVSRQDGDFVVINPWNSRIPEMDWEIPDKLRIPADLVEEVIVEERPLVEYRLRAADPSLTADGHVELAAFCAEHKFKEERLRHLRLALAVEPEHAEALQQIGEAKWKGWARGNPEADPDLLRMEKEYVGLSKPAELAAQWGMMQERGTKRNVAYLERARRSLSRRKEGRQDKVPLTLRSQDASGANYCLFVPPGYDPLKPTPLVIGLHGGGGGGRDSTLVTGSGESAMNFYQDLARQWGWIVACPSALRAPWGNTANGPFLDALLDEMALLFNVDETRIYLVGHSMGGFGTWHWGPARSDIWAAIAPCAGGGGPGGVDGKGLPVYIFHGADDRIVGVGSDRSAAKALLGGKKKKKGVDAVYTELDGVGHGFPSVVRQDIFRFFAGRRKDHGRKRATGPRSSFARKVRKDEIKTFGDPRKLPVEGQSGGDLKDLLAAVRKGGGAGKEAVAAFEGRTSPTAVKRVAAILKSSKSSVDSRALAARALGVIGTPETLKPLARALADEDFRVLEAATWGLGETGLPEAAPHLVRAARQMEDWYRRSLFQGTRIGFNEYEVRLASFEILLDAFAAAGNAEVALPAVTKHVIDLILAPKTKPRVQLDSRFTHIPPRSRAKLTRRLAACLVKLRASEGAALLNRVKEAWPGENSLSAAVAEGLRGLAPETE